MRIVLILGFIANSFVLAAQNLAAFSDYKNYFFTFNSGKTTEVEYMPIKSFKVGGREIAYIDNTGSLKAFYNDSVIKLSDGIISKYTVSDYLMSYSIFKMLKVFDNGNNIFLTGFAESYVTGDSMISFYDSQKDTYAFNIYYRGKTVTLEETSTLIPIKSFKMGDNILAYVNYLDHFKLFYRGNVYKVMTNNRSSPYEAGKNIVGYCNNKYGFTAFYNGSTFDLEDFQPKSFAVGDDLMAYVTATGQFKIFYDGKTQIINSFEPDFYTVKDSLVVYNEGRKFKAFYKGNVYTLEEFVPKFDIEFNTIVYYDLEGRLKCFSSGQSKVISNSSIDEYKLFRNVIWFRVLSQSYIYYQSKVYPQ